MPTSIDWFIIAFSAVSLTFNIWLWFENRRLDREIHDKWMEYWRR